MMSKFIFTHILLRYMKRIQCCPWPKKVAVSALPEQINMYYPKMGFMINDKKTGNKKRFFLYVLVIFIVLVTHRTNAETVDPNRSFSVERYIDLDEKNSNVTLWQRLSMGEEEGSRRFQYALFYCHSTSDTSRGACSRRNIHIARHGTSTVKLRFIEMRSKVAFDLQLTGYSEMFQNSWGECGPNFFDGIKLEINNSHSYKCKQSHAQGKASTFYIEADEIKKIPFGGIWQADLGLNVFLLDHQRTVGLWNVAITLHVRDNNNIAIYFPQFDSATPQVDLKLHTLPTPATPGGEMRGQANLDMCLYDGFNALSKSYQVTLTDDQTVSDRANGTFSVFRDNQPSLEEK
jgi:hypothetical protein